MSFCLTYRSKLTVFAVTDPTSFPCSARTTEVSGGRTGIQALSELLWKDFMNFFLHLVGSLEVALRLNSCVLVMLLTLGAKALTQTHSASCTLSGYSSCSSWDMKHCQVEVQEKYFLTSFKTLRN